MLKSLAAIIISGPLLAWAVPPSSVLHHRELTNLTVSKLSLDARKESDNWGGFYEDDCRRITYLLSDADNNKDDPKNTIKPYLDSPILTARCIGIMGDEKCSKLRLGDCLMNDHGTLKPAENGNFHRSCTYCSLKEDGRKLECLCYPDYVNSPVTNKNEVDLNDFIHNFDGQLRCFGNRGPRSECPYQDSYSPYED